MPPALEHHREQERSDSCVAACLGIVLAWRGQPVEESELHEDAGAALRFAARRLGEPYQVPDTADLLRKAPLWFAEDRALLITVFGPRYVKRLTTRPGGLPSRHGNLAPSGDYVAPLHAVVLVGQDDEDFLLLDPYYPAQGQPLRISADDLVEVFTGELIVCSRGPAPSPAPGP